MSQTFSDPLTWFTISDFSPGIVQNSNFAFGANPVNPVPFKAQAGQSAAQLETTTNCIALPTGGLGPLPGISDYVVDPNSISPAYVNGSIAYGPIGTTPRIPSGGDELLISYEKLSGTSRSWTLNAYQTAPARGFVIISASNTDNENGLQACSMILTELNVDDPTTNGYPRVIFSHNTMGTFGVHGDVVDLAMYPEWTTPVDGSYTSLSGPPGVQAWLIGHQNRVIALTYNQSAWASESTTPTYYFFSAETFDYTEPPNSDVFGDQYENFVQEDPFPHGAWGSISASELFLVRHQGGGYVIQGDLNTPTVTRLPGVTPTNGSVQVAGQTPIGFVYGSANNGVWVWNGGNTSVKLSSQLNDDFFMQSTTYPYNAVSAGPMFNFNTLGDLIYCPNGWIYSITLNSWWKWEVPPTSGEPFTLNDPTLGVLNGVGELAATGTYGPMTWFWPTYDGSGMWCFPQYLVDSGAPSAYRVSRTSPSTSYSWQSYPMPFSQNRQVSIRQVAVRAQGEGTVTVQFNNPYGQSGMTSPVDMSYTDSLHPNIVQSSAAARGTDITMTLISQGSGTNPAPIIYEVSVGYSVEDEVNPT